MDFSKMNGYEFENFVAGLLAKLGFSVSQTSYSHDGGIDLVARYNEPIFSGKYIIQCKNWGGSVGQPEVRDLYGVVMSENANKGILITPSDFTEQAYDFAKNKNLELVNGIVLNTILNKLGVEQSAVENLDSANNFNREQYEYLSMCIDNDPKNKSNYFKMLEFLKSYVTQHDTCVKSEDVFDKLIQINLKLSKNCFKKKDEYIYKLACIYRVAEIEIMRGNLGVATNILLDNDWFYLDEWHPMCNTLLNFKNNDISVVPCYPKILSRNLYSAFKGIGFDLGCQLITSKSIKPFSAGVWNNNTNILQEEKKSNEQLQSFYNGALNDVFIYTDHAYYAGKIYSSTINDTDSTKFFRENYYKNSNEKIIEEVLLAFRQHGLI